MVNGFNTLDVHGNLRPVIGINCEPLERIELTATREYMLPVVVEADKAVVVIQLADFAAEDGIRHNATTHFHTLSLPF